MAIENLRVFQKADIDKFGNINFLFKNEEWTDGVLTNSKNHRGATHITQCQRSEFELVQAFFSMAGFFPVPGDEPVQTDIDRLSGKILESKRILNEQELELYNVRGGIEIDGEIVQVL